MVGEYCGTIVFSALSATGLGLIFGFHSRVLFLVLVVALCMPFGMMARLASVASFGVFIIGVLLWAGLVPKTIELSDMSWLTGAKSNHASDTTVAEPARLQQLAAA